MLTRTELTALMVTMPEIIKPVTVTLACGHSVLNEAGTEIFNYYDLRVEVMTKACTDPDIDTSGDLPNGITYWITSVDCSRSCCIPCANKHHPDLF